MALKYTQKPITMAEYGVIMEKLITKYKDVPVYECMIKLLEEASKYRIVETDCNKCKSKCKWERDSIRICNDFKPIRAGKEAN